MPAARTASAVCPLPSALYTCAVLIEAEAIPSEPAQLRGERLLVLAPHPDDEVIGCGGLVAQHLRERREVRVVVATDGAQAGAAETREEESRCVWRASAKSRRSISFVSPTVSSMSVPPRACARFSSRFVPI